METIKVTLIKVAVSDEKKDGTKLITKNGKPFWKVGIQTNEHGDKWINGLAFNQVTWKEGDTVELMIGEEEYQGVKRLKFGMPTQQNIQGEKIDKVLVELAFIKHKVDQIASVVVKDNYPTPESEGINTEDTPF